MLYALYIQALYVVAASLFIRRCRADFIDIIAVTLISVHYAPLLRRAAAIGERECRHYYAAARCQLLVIVAAVMPL